MSDKPCADPAREVAAQDALIALAELAKGLESLGILDAHRDTLKAIKEALMTAGGKL